MLLSDSAADCGSPPPVRHGYVIYSPANTTYGHELEYHCHRGYWFSQQVFTRVSTCDRRGNWTSVTDCVCKSSMNFKLTITAYFAQSCRNSRQTASVVTKALAETETKTEAVYLKTEAEAQSSWPILLTVLSFPNRRKIKLNHRYMMFTCNAAAVRSLRA